MWKFIQGVTQPKPQKQTAAEKKSYFEQYEKKRKRKFIDEWSKYSWLEDTETGLRCAYCSEFSTDRGKPYVKGEGSYKHDSIGKHESSKMHERCQLIAEAKQKSKAESEAFKIIKTMNQENIQKLDKLFRNCHAVVVKNRPVTDFLWLCNLDEAKNLDIGKTYRNTEYAKKFIEAIAEVEFQEVRDLVKESSFITIIGDGSTDISVKEQEMWYIRTCIQGEIYVRFIGVESSEKANAETIVKGLKSIVASNLKCDWGEFSSKLVSIACDGASVMLGSRTGVAARLREENPSLVAIHCMAHRLELALKDAAKTIKLYQKTVSVLAMGLFYFYHNSPLNRSMLQRSFDAVRSEGDRRLLMPLRVGGTRWIQHTVHALENLHGSYKYIIQHLGQLSEPVERVSVDSKARAVAFLKMLRSKDVICFVMFLLDILKPLRRLSVLLQERSCVVGKQHAELESTLELIRKYKTSDGPYLRKVIEKDQFEGTELTHCNVAEFSSAKRKLLENIEVTLQARFAEFSCPGVIQATRIADIQSWPLSWEQLKVYGDKQLQTIVDHFTQAPINAAEAEIEWALLKREIYDQYFKQDEVVIPTLSSLNFKYRSQFRNILSVMDLVNSMSPSSAEAERGFSQLKTIKTSSRNRMSQTLLNHCLAIRLLSPQIQNFDPSPAIDYWNGAGVRARRPNFKEKNVKKSKSCYSYKLHPQNNNITSSSEHSQSGENVMCVSEDEASEPRTTVSVANQSTATVSLANRPTHSEVFNKSYSDSEYNSGSDTDSDLEEDIVFDNLMMFTRD